MMSSGDAGTQSAGQAAPGAHRKLSAEKLGGPLAAAHPSPWVNASHQQAREI